MTVIVTLLLFWYVWPNLEQNTRSIWINKADIQIFNLEKKWLNPEAALQNLIYLLIGSPT